jgi:hypothetical protein
LVNVLGVFKKYGTIFSCFGQRYFDADLGFRVLPLKLLKNWVSQHEIETAFPGNNLCLLTGIWKSP